MTESVLDRVLQAALRASTLYYRLVLLVGPAGTGKTETLRELSSRTNAPLVNVSLELARRMLDLTERQRPLYVRPLLEKILQEAASRETDGHPNALARLILLDNTELLFDVHLKQDPLQLLQAISRDMTVIASWNGSLAEGYVTYAVPGHPEYRRYEVGDLLAIHLV